MELELILDPNFLIFFEGLAFQFVFSSVNWEKKTRSSKSTLKNLCVENSVSKIAYLGL